MVIVVPAQDYRRAQREVPDFAEFLLTGPDFSLLELDRPRQSPRDVDLIE